MSYCKRISSIILLIIFVFTQLLFCGSALSIDKPISKKVSSQHKKAVLKAEREKTLAENLLIRRKRETARLGRKEARLAKKQNRIKIKKEAEAKRRNVSDIFQNGKTYYDSGLYKDAIVTWYEVLLLDPSSRTKSDERKAESLIKRTEAKIKLMAGRREGKLKAQAEKEAKRAKLRLEKEKGAFRKKKATEK